MARNIEVDALSISNIMNAHVSVPYLRKSAKTAPIIIKLNTIKKRRADVNYRVFAVFKTAIEKTAVSPKFMD